MNTYCASIPDQSILCITSKIVSICEKSIVPKAGINKQDLIAQEADAILETRHCPYGITLIADELGRCHLHFLAHVAKSTLRSSFIGSVQVDQLYMRSEAIPGQRKTNQLCRSLKQDNP